MSEDEKRANKGGQVEPGGMFVASDIPPLSSMGDLETLIDRLTRESMCHSLTTPTYKAPGPSRKVLCELIEDLANANPANPEEFLALQVRARQLLVEMD